jgi:hypothetical protein
MQQTTMPLVQLLCSTHNPALCRILSFLPVATAKSLPRSDEQVLANPVMVFIPSATN